MLKRSVKIFLFFLLAGNVIHAQEILTIESAIQTGLKNNFDVLIAKNSKDISAAQNNYGNAGMSPSVSLNGNLNLANVNSHQEFNTGAVQDRAGAG